MFPFGKNPIASQLQLEPPEYVFVSRVALAVSLLPLLAIFYLQSSSLALPYLIGFFILSTTTFSATYRLLPRGAHLIQTVGLITLIGVTQINLIEIDSAASVICSLPLLLGLYLFTGLMRWLNVTASLVLLALSMWTQFGLGYRPSAVSIDYYPYFSIAIFIGFIVFLIAIMGRVKKRFGAVNGRLSQEKERYRTLFDNAPEAYLILQARDGALLECNKGLERMLGGTRDQLLGKFPYELSPEFQPDGTSSLDGNAKIARTVIKQGEMKFEWVHQRLNGEAFWVEVEIRSGFYMDQIVFFSTWREIGVRKRLEQKLLELANNDQLTGLPNRRLLRESFNWAISRADRGGKRISLMFIDVDNFKYINDVYGHDAGDQLLLSVAKRLQSAVRQEDICARLGGDEFVLVLEHLDNETAAEHVAQKLMHVFAQPFKLEQQSVQASLSIGIAVYPNDGDSFDELMRCADTAMYRSKADGRAQYCFYSAEMATKAADRLRIESGLRTALDNEELRLVYQPLVNLADGHIIGVEVLVRWQHPTDGMIPPISFLPVAEDSVLIEEIEAWIFYEACKQAQTWYKAGLNFGTMAINASARGLQRGYVVNLLEQSLKETGCHPHLIEIEVSENFVMSKSAEGLGHLQGIRKLGVSLSLDDFGTGYSSLSYVTKMPISKLKIDKSLVANILSDSNNREIVSATIAMAKRLKLVTVAEGIESREQAKFLRVEGCDIGQGYLFSYPLSTRQCERVLEGKEGNMMELRVIHPRDIQ